jgi:hypothetical protein
LQALNGTAAFIALFLVSPINCAHAQSPSRSTSIRGLMSAAEARQFFVCKTNMSFAAGHGTQVYYLRPDGTEFLWYPGNAGIVRAKWKIVAYPISNKPGREYASMCFQYGTNTYNPVTKQAGGNWECRLAHDKAQFVVDRVDGDVFGLALRQAVPFVLGRERTSIAELRRKLEQPESPLGVGSDSGCPPTISWNFSPDLK